MNNFPIFLVIIEILAAVHFVSSTWTLSELLGIEQLAVCEKGKLVRFVTFRRDTLVFTDFGSNSEFSGVVKTENSILEMLRLAGQNDKNLDHYSYFASRSQLTFQNGGAGLEIHFSKTLTVVLFLVPIDGLYEEEFYSLNFVNGKGKIMPISVYNGRSADGKTRNEAQVMVVKFDDLNKNEIVCTSTTVIRNQDGKMKFRFICDTENTQGTSGVGLPEKYAILAPSSGSH